MSEVRQKIPARLESAVKGGYVTGAKDIVDDALGKAQNVVNEEHEEAISDLQENVGTGGSVDERIAAEKNRATNVEQGLDTRLGVVEQLAEISVGGGDIGIATADDFESDDSSDLAKVPTVGAILGGANEGVYDISARHNGAKYADLAEALGTNGANVPVGVRKGGMSIKFIQSSDNMYVQYRLVYSVWSTNVANWQSIEGETVFKTGEKVKEVGIDDEPTAESDNLVKSGGVKTALDTKLNASYNENTFYITDVNGYIIAQIGSDGVSSVDVKVKKDGELVSLVGELVSLINLIEAEKSRAIAEEEKKLNKVIDDDRILITDANGYIIVKVDKDGIHSAQDKHAVACMVLGENYYPTAAPTRNSDGNVTHVDVMFATGVEGEIDITYTNGVSTSIDVTYGNYIYTITINRDSEGNVTTVSVE